MTEYSCAYVNIFDSSPDDTLFVNWVCVYTRIDGFVHSQNFDDLFQEGDTIRHLDLNISPLVQNINIRKLINPKIIEISTVIAISCKIPHNAEFPKQIIEFITDIDPHKIDFLTYHPNLVGLMPNYVPMHVTIDSHNSARGFIETPIMKCPRLSIYFDHIGITQHDLDECLQALEGADIGLLALDRSINSDLEFDCEIVRKINISALTTGMPCNDWISLLKNSSIKEIVNHNYERVSLNVADLVDCYSITELTHFQFDDPKLAEQILARNRHNASELIFKRVKAIY